MNLLKELWPLPILPILVLLTGWIIEKITSIGSDEMIIPDHVGHRPHSWPGCTCLRCKEAIANVKAEGGAMAETVEE